MKIIRLVEGDLYMLGSEGECIFTTETGEEVLISVEMEEEENVEMEEEENEHTKYDN